MVGKANRMLGMLKRTLENRDPEKDLYVAQVRQKLEYAVQLWNPNLRGDFEKIERVKRRDTYN